MNHRKSIVWYSTRYHGNTFFSIHVHGEHVGHAGPPAVSGLCEREHFTGFDLYERKDLVEVGIPDPPFFGMTTNQAMDEMLETTHYQRVGIDSYFFFFGLHATSMIRDLHFSTEVSQDLGTFSYFQDPPTQNWTFSPQGSV